MTPTPNSCRNKQFVVTLTLSRWCSKLLLLYSKCIQIIPLWIPPYKPNLSCLKPATSDLAVVVSTFSSLKTGPKNSHDLLQHPLRFTIHLCPEGCDPGEGLFIGFLVGVGTQSSTQLRHFQLRHIGSGVRFHNFANHTLDLDVNWATLCWCGSEVIVCDCVRIWSHLALVGIYPESATNSLAAISTDLLSNVIQAVHYQVSGHIFMDMLLITGHCISP